MAPSAHRRKTYDALLDAALGLTAQGRGFASLSLREVTRTAGVVPTAFYRHFESMDELGLALVDCSAGALRTLMHEARSAELDGNHLVRRSVDTFFDFVAQHAALFLFLVREQTGGSSAVRDALAVVIRLFIADLATDLARAPLLRHVATADLNLLAELITNTVSAAIPGFLGAGENQRQAVRNRVEKQLRIILLGAAQWQASPSQKPA
ncbi:MAG: HTH-type transcriptional repressor FabR [Nevskiaceae bacterium]|nr:MAG: HTH-type transcriptional repressor FabR [Nevskiaceae bacterium]TBR74834.1 MAG: HTH-type transcriptional repressor FabR [Nevskiaceae bacterium]